MESKGFSESSSGLKLGIAIPGLDLNSYASNDGNGSGDDENATKLLLLNTTNHPPHGEGGQMEDVLTVNGVNAEVNAGGIGSPPLQAHKHPRRLSKEQTDQLEATFQQSNFIDRGTKEALAERLKLTMKQVNLWFMNRRCRLKKEQSKQQLEALTKKVGRLRRKVEKLKECNKDLKRKLKETSKASPPMQQPSPSVMLFPFPAGLNTLAGLCPSFVGNNKVTDMAAAAAAALNTQKGSATAAALPSTTGAQPMLPSGGGSSSI